MKQSTRLTRTRKTFTIAKQLEHLYIPLLDLNHLVMIVNSDSSSALSEIRTGAQEISVIFTSDFDKEASIANHTIAMGVKGRLYTQLPTEDK